MLLSLVGSVRIVTLKPDGMEMLKEADVLLASVAVERISCSIITVLDSDDRGCKCGCSSPP